MQSPVHDKLADLQTFPHTLRPYKTETLAHVSHLSDTANTLSRHQCLGSGFREHGYTQYIRYHIYHDR